MADADAPNDRPRLTILGNLILLAMIGACFYTAYLLIGKTPAAGVAPAQNGGDSPKNGQPLTAEQAPPAPPVYDGAQTEIGIAYGTEKKNWLVWAQGEFLKTDAGRKIKINLIPMGSLEGAQAAVAGDKRLTVWSPASAAYKDTFVQDWQAKYGGNPIAKEENLALTPMVFVMWEERYQAFIRKYKEVTFQTMGLALQEKGGWDAIAGKPEWGLFKVGHTHPNQSNSGLMTLVLMACDYHKKTRGIELKDITDAGFQNWLQDFERGVSGLSNSTGTMMKEMVLKGPSSYDAMIVYENVVIDYLKGAQGRWGDLRVVYPKFNLWNENPYYVIDAAWSGPEQRKAAGVFLEFLMSEPIQRQALEHGFRPGNPSVPINQESSPFKLYAKYGLKVEIDTVCEAPKAEVVFNLLASWQRSQGKR